MVNMDSARKHHELLQLILKMGLSKSTGLRIIDEVNRFLKDRPARMAKTDELIALLKSCETEEDVIRKLDEAGI